MKKILIALMGLLMAFFLIACDSGEDSQSNVGSSSTATDSEFDNSSEDDGESSDASSSESDGDRDTGSSDEDHLHTLQKVKATGATCTKDGNIAYWTCLECEKAFLDEACEREIALADTVIAATGHSAAKVEAKAATCTQEGNLVYWTCENCNKFYADENCATEIVFADTVIAATGHSAMKTEAKPATCTQEGNIAYWTCGNCDKFYADENFVTEIALEDTVLEMTGHDYGDEGVCVCGRNVADKNLWIVPSDNCASVVYTEGLGWKATAATEDKYYIQLSADVIAYYIAQGYEQLTISFADVFDGADFGENSPLNCRVWIIPPQAADGSEDWTYPISSKMQTELDYNVNGTYYHTLDLLDETYDYAKYGLRIYIDNVAATTGEEVGACYIADIGYSVKTDVMDKANYIKPGENCGEVEYTEDLGWKVSSAKADKYYIKINHEVTAAMMAEGNDQMTITFSGAFDGADFGESNPLNCRIWILPPKAANGENDWGYSVSSKMQTELTKNADGTYSHTIYLISEYQGSKIHDFAAYDLTIYIDNFAANTGAHVGSIYIKDIEYSVKPPLVEPAKAEYFSVNENCASVTYTEGLGWKATAAAGATHYYFKLNKAVTAYYIAQGYDKMTISFGSSFDGTAHEGRPTACRIWFLPTKKGGGSHWEYKIDYIHNLNGQMDGTYAWTVDLKDATYDFEDADFNFYLDTVDGGNGSYVGACYVYNVTFSKSEVVEEESYLGGVKLYQMGTTNSRLSMGYVMLTEANEVIVLDSGRNAEEGKVLYDFIVSLKGSAVVDAWYLSHYHGDHIEALTQILNLYDITINNLYFDFPTDDALIQQYGDGDNVFLYDFYEALENNASKVKNIVTPKKGDVMQYTGLEIRVLNDSLFGEGMKYVNNSSVVYKAVTPDESVLFLGDMGDYGMKLLEDSYFKSEIETCTVIQMAHHGNSDLLGSFYDNIKEIKVCLFPCLAWVFNNDAGSGFNSGTMTTVQTRQYLESRGVTIMLTQVNGMVELV